MSRSSTVRAGVLPALTGIRSDSSGEVKGEKAEERTVGDLHKTRAEFYAVFSDLKVLKGLPYLLRERATWRTCLRSVYIGIASAYSLLIAWKTSVKRGKHG